MSKVISKNAALFNHPVDEIYRTVTDFVSYSKWYPKPFKIEVLDLDSHAVGTTLKIQNGPFVKWLAKVTKFEPNHLIAIDYIDGAWIGKTFWRFEEQDGGKTKLSLEINLEINKLWLRFISKFIDFSKRHSKQMHHVFISLEHYLRYGKKEI
jgi:ribosome-associated toxin RatA of RatAB toxin-antitoxin module